MVKHFIRVDNYGGIDWHDSRTISDCLQYKDSFEIPFEHIEETILKHVHKELRQMKSVCIDQGVKTVTRIADVPTWRQFEAMVRSKLIETVGTDLPPILTFRSADRTTFENEDGTTVEISELAFSYDVTKKMVVQDFMGGQVSYITGYTIQDINEDDVRYLACETFLAPNKGVDCIRRIVHKPFTSEKEAKAFLKEMTLHNEKNPGVWAKSRKEMFVQDVRKLADSDWYCINMACLDTEAYNKRIHKPTPFYMYPDQHMQHLLVMS